MRSKHLDSTGTDFFGKISVSFEYSIEIVLRASWRSHRAICAFLVGCIDISNMGEVIRITKASFWNLRPVAQIFSYLLSIFVK